MKPALLWTMMVVPLLAASSSSAQLSPPSAIARAQAEARQAEAEAARLSTAAGQARGEAARLAADRLAAAAAITAAEARITEMDAGLAAKDAVVRANAARLAQKQAPLAALVAGLVNLGRRPPLVSLADDHDLTQMVRMRALLDVAVPRIRANSATLSAELAASRRFADEARQARRQVTAARATLSKRQQSFAALEARSLGRAAKLDAGSLGADDRMLAAGEGVAALGNQWERDRAGRRLALELALLPGAPRRPFAPDSRRLAPPFGFILPVDAPVIGGLGQVSTSGIRARGTTFAARAGAPVVAPADGILVFAGPYRRHDGIAIIDHGKGWMSLLVGVRSTAAKGTRIERGAKLGRALGPVTLELSINGRPQSAALIVGSSQSLSINTNGG
ncbi:MAG: peptidoglycan DD-metalloendopeptidase family protein [Sphingomonas bacterium]|nr:peptidoglycan DD-metalloendopeptidase family protein [Sphingomonas bacterium]